MQTTEMHQQSMHQLGECLSLLAAPGIREFCDKSPQGGARKANPGAECSPLDVILSRTVLTREKSCLHWTVSPGTAYAWVLQVNHS